MSQSPLVHSKPQLRGQGTATIFNKKSACNPSVTCPGSPQIVPVTFDVCTLSPPSERPLQRHGRWGLEVRKVWNPELMQIGGVGPPLSTDLLTPPWNITLQTHGLIYFLLDPELRVLRDSLHSKGKRSMESSLGANLPIFSSRQKSYTKQENGTFHAVVF